MDFAHVRSAGDVLIIVDSATGWIEAFPTRDRTSASVIKCLRAVFSRFGMPKLLVSDNAPEFTSPALNQWVEAQGVKKMETPPYFFRSNGAAERAVRTVKQGLAAWSAERTHLDFNAYLQKVLL
ncbi:MAG: transposase family protein, partial [Kangiellaceae bacterium]|nr:transposase family protein [Kangiellaceae bacterium]